jgi:RNA polymerase sigma-70 factor (ECF subfamily)
MQNSRADYHSRTDEELVSLAQAGENGAFAELIERYHKNCEKVAVSILRDRQDAEDEVQNACWKAYEHLDRFQGDSKFSTWLTRIVVNQCLMRLRQTRRARFVYLDEPLTTEDARTLDLPSMASSPEEALGKTEVAHVLEREISRIPPLLRHVFVLRDVQQLPMPDVAAKLGISVAAAKSRLLRARLELRQRLTKHQGRLGPATLTA